jgi:hypothetical protein
LNRLRLAIVGDRFVGVNSFVAPDKFVATKPAAKFLSGWKKSNSGFEFPPDASSKIRGFHGFFQTARRVLGGAQG